MNADSALFSEPFTVLPVFLHSLLDVTFRVHFRNISSRNSEDKGGVFVLALSGLNLGEIDKIGFSRVIMVFVMDQDQYFVFIPEEGSQGPFSRRGLFLLASQKKINAETLVCQAGEEEWRPYGEIFSTSSSQTSAAPGAPQPLNNATGPFSQVMAPAGRNSSKEVVRPDAALDEEIQESGGSWVVPVLIGGGGLICILTILAGILLAVSDAPSMVKVYALMGVPGGILSGACLAAFGYIVRYQNIIIQCQRVIIRCERGCLRMLGDLAQKR
ncbi:MAG: GYF domain-containing protein [Akkermansia muciniphila]